MHWLICGPDLQIYRFWILTLVTFWNFWIVHEIGFGYLDNITSYHFCEHNKDEEWTPIREIFSAKFSYEHKYLKVFFNNYAQSMDK